MAMNRNYATRDMRAPRTRDARARRREQFNRELARKQARTPKPEAAAKATGRN